MNVEGQERRTLPPLCLGGLREDKDAFCVRTTCRESVRERERKKTMLESRRRAHGGTTCLSGRFLASSFRDARTAGDGHEHQRVKIYTQITFTHNMVIQANRTPGDADGCTDLVHFMSTVQLQSNLFILEKLPGAYIHGLFFTPTQTHTYHTKTFAEYLMTDCSPTVE